MSLFKKGPPPQQTALAMIGARAGDRVLLAGQPDPALVVEVARITGLSGQTILATHAGTRKPFDAAAASAGVLLEVIDMEPGSTRVPATGGTHDVVVIHVDLHPLDAHARAALVTSALDALRPGGRIVAIEGRRRAGFFSGRVPTVPADVVLSLLTDAGALAVRTLGREDDITYFEARKAR